MTRQSRARRNAAILRLVAGGWSYTQIGRALMCSRCVVAGVVHRQKGGKVKPPRRKAEAPLPRQPWNPLTDPRPDWMRRPGAI